MNRFFILEDTESKRVDNCANTIFTCPSPNFFFPMNHGKNLIIHMRFERGEFYYISNGGDRNYSEK